MDRAPGQLQGMFERLNMEKENSNKLSETKAASNLPHFLYPPFCSTLQCLCVSVWVGAFTSHLDKFIKNFSKRKLGFFYVKECTENHSSTFQGYESMSAERMLGGILQTLKGLQEDTVWSKNSLAGFCLNIREIFINITYIVV